MDDVEADWGVIDGDEPPSAPVGHQPMPSKKMRKPFAFNNLFINTKSKFYNLCKPMSKSLPDFSSSPVVMLGITYTAPSKGKAAVRSRQQQRPQQPASKPLYTFFNKLSVVPWTEEIRGDSTPPTSRPAETELLPSHILSFLHDFRSRVWLTYRSNFAAIEGSSLVTDMGWGCMLRTGQMLLAQALVTHYLGRDWRIQTGENMMTYRELLRWFADEPSPRSPYSIHNLARTGFSKFGKQIGDWFEPTTISEALRLLVHQHSPDGLKMYVPKDGVIYRHDVYQLCVVQPADGPARHSPRRPDIDDDTDGGTADADGDADEGLESSSDAMRHSNGSSPELRGTRSDDHHSELMSSAESECEYLEGAFDAPEQVWSPVIILVPVRLGIQCLNPIYIPTLKAFFSFPQSLGVIGGKPHSSFFFVGYQDNKVLYMDPHFVQPTVKIDDDPVFPIESYRMEIPQAMPFVDIDPSLALGFLCSTQAEFDDFCANATAVGRANPCVFSIAEQHTVYKGSSSASSSSSSSSTNGGSCSILLDEDEEEYVLV